VKSKFFRMYSDDSSSDSDSDSSSDTDYSDSGDDSCQEVANLSSQWALENAHNTNDNVQSRIGFENEKIFITVRRRVRNKHVTIVSGLTSNGFDTNLILTALRKELRCGGTVTAGLLRKGNGHMSGAPKGRSGATRLDGDMNPVIQLNGDHHVAVMRFLVSQEICRAADIVCKGCFR
jgi:translation initiation factor 1 (eIF-1/SUI1)